MIVLCKKNQNAASPYNNNNANTLIVGKMKDKTCGVHIKGFIELKFKNVYFHNRRQS